MKRSEIKENDKWDLTKIIKDDKEYDATYKKILDIVDQIVKLKGVITESADNLYKYLSLDDELTLYTERFYVYSYLYHFSDTNDNKGLVLKDKADKVEELINEQTSFVRSELLSVKYDYIKKLIKSDKRLDKYSFVLEKMFRYEDHTLSKEEEQIISLASNAFGTPDNAFSALDNADATFGTIKVDGEDVEITHSNYYKLLCKHDREVRKNAFQLYHQFYAKHQNTLAEMYKGQVKEDLFMSKVRKFNSPLEASVYNDNISIDVYNNLIDTIHDNLGSLHDYLAFRKETLGLDELHMYDLVCNLLKQKKKKYTFEQARDIVLEAVKPLGEEYVNDLSQAFTNRWIDIYPNDGKRSGAYQWGAYRIDPYVSMNFEGNGDSVSTMAHELGHAMHSYYSDRNQDISYAQYPIFLAEIASTVNETLLCEYMINNARDDEEKLGYITEFLDRFRATVYRQVMFAEFEKIAHEMEQNGEALTPQSLGDVYYKLNKEYYGDDVVSDDLIRYEWSRIPHFYTSFYVYKYATGLCSAIAIASDILEGKKGAREKYLEFLKSGASKYPLDTLKACGVDMTSSEPIIKSIKFFEKRLAEAKEIAKKVK